jgi:hypothetical protein
MSESEHERAVALHRLALLARERGLRILRDREGRFLVTSHSHPRLVYYVTAVSCECPGFIRHGRCTHQALLLFELGWLPEVEGMPSPLVKCVSCSAGKVARWVAGHMSGCQDCDVCGGSGYVPPLTALDAA